MIELVIERGGKELVSFPFTGGELRVGRAGTNDVSLPEPTISRNQFRIEKADGGLVLIDTSGKGTVVDGKKTDQASIQMGAQIRLGSLTATLREIPEEAAVGPTAVGGVTSELPGRAGSGQEMILCGTQEGRPLQLPLRGKVLNLGQEPSNDLVLQDGFVSSFHCRLFQKEGAWFVADLDSTNGTRVNGVLVGEARLEPGSTLTLGKTTLQVEVPAAQQDEIFEGMVSRDSAMRPVFEIIRRAAPSDETILITGDSGTGKELVAQACHRLSARAERPLVSLNCAAITKELMESELFGHEKGAFTGALVMRRGLFEEADGGTLLLDEIGELMPDLQAKLLRALEAHEIRRVGSNKTIPVDVRVLAATHRFLPDLVREGRFREDLYFRICVIEIQLPPLRKRREDIPLLARHFLEQVTRHTDPKEIGEQAMDNLCAYGFPGNVRELKHIVARAAILCPERVIQPKHLAFAPPTLADRVAESRLYRKGKTLHEVERETIRQALDACDGNQRAASRLLGIARSTLLQKMEKYNLPNRPAGAKG